MDAYRVERLRLRHARVRVGVRVDANGIKTTP
jgi:hypothetical protein